MSLCLSIQRLAALSLGLLALAWVTYRSIALFPVAEEATVPSLAAPSLDFLAQLPLAFTPNQGQYPAGVQFAARHDQAAIAFAEGSVHYAFYRRLDEASASDSRFRAISTPEHASYERLTLQMHLVDAHAGLQAVGEAPHTHQSNFFRSNDPEQWQTQVPTYSRIRYTNAYPGIDLVYYGARGRLKYDFILAPGADPADIAFTYEGAEAMRVNAAGQLILTTAFGRLMEDTPFTYQVIAADTVIVPSAYVLEEGRVGFTVGRYDPTYPLVIDPALSYSTLIGGVHPDAGLDVALDADGHIYVTGYTSSFDFPSTPTAYNSSHNDSDDEGNDDEDNGEGETDGDPTYRPRDAFVFKLNRSGTGLLYSTYIGGSNGSDTGTTIAADQEGNVYVGGYSHSNSFPVTPRAYRRFSNPNRYADGFVLKLNATGSKLLYSTLLIGHSSYSPTWVNDLVIDQDGHAYVIGTTGDNTFPTTPGAFDRSSNGWDDVFVLKLNATGTNVLFSTFLGGSELNTGESIARDQKGNIYVAGKASKGLQTSAGAFDRSHNGSSDCFVAKLNATASTLLYSTYLGGTHDDRCSDLAIDAKGSVHVVGTTRSSNFPTSGNGFVSPQTKYSDVFVAKLNPAGTALDYVARIGGSDVEEGAGIALDEHGHAYITGETFSKDFPTTSNAFDRALDGKEEVFVVKLDPSGRTLRYATFLGRSGDQAGYAIAYAGNQEVFITGTTTSPNYPITAGAYTTRQAGVILSKVNTGALQHTADLPGLDHGSLDWGDYDRDGDLDLLVTGTDGPSAITRIYAYNATTAAFAEGHLATPALVGVQNSHAEWGDYDGDGDLDILLTGDTGTQLVTKIYRNDGTQNAKWQFREVSVAGGPLPGLRNGVALWGDYDNDGDLDIYLGGDGGGGLLARLYRNDGPAAAGAWTFTVVTTQPLNLIGLKDHTAEWGDYDRDGDLDLLAAGQGDASVGLLTVVYENQGPAGSAWRFIQKGANLTNITRGAVAWGDYDNDGLLNPAVAGLSPTGDVAEVYTSGTFVNKTTFAGMRLAAMAWGDYNNDGNQDFIVTGRATGSGAPESNVYRGDGAGRFTKEMRFSISGTEEGAIKWGDYDNNGTLDLALMGRARGGQRTLQIYTNTLLLSHAAPKPPQHQSAVVSSNSVTLTWGPGADDTTPAPGLTYNLYLQERGVQTAVPPPHADRQTGLRHIVRRGQAGQGTIYTVHGLKPLTTYTWRVQAIDKSYRGSVFSEAHSFTTGLEAAATPFPTSIKNGRAAWADVDTDGDLDVAISGTTPTQRILHIFKNTNGSFVEVTLGTQGLASGTLQWGDFDKDGDPDLLAAGLNEQNAPETRLYRNDKATAFTLIKTNLPPLSPDESAAWGDYDHDGDLDVVLTGITNCGAASITLCTQLFRNDGPAPGDAWTFTLVKTALLGYRSADVAWGHIDNDGFLDVLISGNPPVVGDQTDLYRNNGDGTFTDYNAGLRGASGGQVAWGDYNQDGFLDALVVGQDTRAGDERVTLYRNDAKANGFIERTFTRIDLDPTRLDLRSGSGAWGDADGDGDLDVLLSGTTSKGIPRSHLYLNTNGTFSAATLPLPPMEADAMWVDYNNDGRLDPFFISSTATAHPVVLLKNTIGVANTPPTPPAVLQATSNSGQLTLSWAAGTDAETKVDGLSYNIRLGTRPGASDVKVPHANALGYRQLGPSGNRGLIGGSSRVLPLTDLQPSATYYWSVQAIDNHFAGSAFSAEGQFTTPSAFTPGTKPLLGVTNSDAAWGDFTSDNTLDLAIIGLAGTTPVTRLYENDKASLKVLPLNLPGVYNGHLAWNDFNGDSDPDLLLLGLDANRKRITKLFRNDGRSAGSNWSFTEITTNLPGFSDGEAAWGDVDLDGDQDLALVGNTGTPTIKYYRNDGPPPGMTHDAATAWNFQDIVLHQPGLTDASVSWVDIEGDGRLELFVIGWTGSAPFARLYYNNGITFVPHAVTFAPLRSGSIAWGDGDQDGDPDLLLTGLDAQNIGQTLLYRNDSQPNKAAFTQITTPFPGVYNGSARWGDYDADGDLDVLVNGRSTSGPITQLFQNGATGRALTFIRVNQTFPGTSSGTAEWGDYTSDRNLDVVLLGDPQRSFLFNNNAPRTNAAPARPAGLTATLSGDEVLLQWNASTDNETPSTGLTYNVRAWNPTQNVYQVPPLSTISGTRQVAVAGSVGGTRTARLNLPPGTYYWSVQSIDNSFESSDFSVDHSFTIPTPPNPNPGIPLYASGAHQGYPNETLLLELTLGTDATPVDDLFGLGFALGFDAEKMEVLSIRSGDFFSKEALFFEDINNTTGEAAVSFAERAGAAPRKGAGTLATVEVRLKADAPSGSVSLMFDNLQAINTAGDPLSIVAQPIDLVVLDFGIWPGDTNRDCTVDAGDVLPLGLHFGQTGPSRPDAKLPWSRQAVPTWSIENAAYADTNGDGAVNQNDLLAIGLNFGQGRPAVSGCLSSAANKQPSGARFAFDPLPAGTTLTVPLYAVHAPDAWLGAAFDVSFDPAVLAFQSLELPPGFDDAQAVTFEHLDETRGVLATAFTRTDHRDEVLTTPQLATLTFSAIVSMPSPTHLTLGKVHISQADGSIHVLTEARLAQEETPSDQATPTFAVHGAYPNPFNPVTTIQFDLPTAAEVQVDLYDVMGRRVWHRPAQPMAAGARQGIRIDGSALASGIYFYRIVAQGGPLKMVDTGRLVLLK